MYTIKLKAFSWGVVAKVTGGAFVVLNRSIEGATGFGGKQLLLLLNYSGIC